MERQTAIACPLCGASGSIIILPMAYWGRPMMCSQCGIAIMYVRCPAEHPAAARYYIDAANPFFRKFSKCHECRTKHP